MSERWRYTLSEDDQRAIDALVEAGFEVESTPDVLRTRTEIIAGLLRNLDILGDEGAEVDLVHGGSDAESGESQGLVEGVMGMIAAYERGEVLGKISQAGGENARGLGKNTYLETEGNDENEGQNALKSVVLEGFWGENGQNSDSNVRTEQLMNVVELLGQLPDEKMGDLLVERTLAAIEAHEEGLEEGAESISAEICHLSEADGRTVDAFFESGRDSERVGSADADRAARLKEVVGLLDVLEDERTGDLLAERTMRQIRDEERTTRFARHIDAMAAAGEEKTGAGIGLRELVSVAAMFLVAVSLLWPVLSVGRQASREMACQANLGAVGRGIVKYGSDYGGMLPAAHFRPGDEWYKLNKAHRENGKEYVRSNSAHLAVGVREGYISLKNLDCSEAPTPAALKLSARTMRDWTMEAPNSYSYQNQFTTEPRGLDDGGPKFVILVDRNPQFDYVDGELRYNGMMGGLDKLANSRNHGGRGQNALMSDMSVGWLSKPVVNGDNIYHAGKEGFDFYTGVEGPAGDGDSFNVH